MPERGTRNGPGREFDWEDARRRLRRLDEAADNASRRAGDEQAILRARAAALALPTALEAERPLVQHLCLACAGDVYALPINQFDDVFAAPVFGVPGVRPPLLGIVSHRGAIIAVIDVPWLLGRATESRHDTPKIAVLSIGGTQLGLAVEEVQGIAALSLDDIAPLQSSGEGETHRAIQGIAPGGWIVLDGSYLTADARLIVDEEISVVRETER